MGVGRRLDLEAQGGAGLGARGAVDRELGPLVAQEGQADPLPSDIRRCDVRKEQPLVVHRGAHHGRRPVAGGSLRGTTPEFLAKHPDVVEKVLTQHHAITERLTADPKGQVPALGAALTVFALAVAGFLVLRVLGIGPAGSLLAAGKISAQDRVVVAAFERGHQVEGELLDAVGPAVGPSLADCRSDCAGAARTSGLFSTWWWPIRGARRAASSSSASGSTTRRRRRGASRCASTWSA